MTTEPENTEEPDAIFQVILQSLREEGGATKENLILATLGYVSRALDRFQEATKAGAGMLPLSDAQLRGLYYVLMDIGVSNARFAAKLAEAGEPVSEWASIGTVEAHDMTRAVLSGMIVEQEPKQAAPEAAPEPEPKAPEITGQN